MPIPAEPPVETITLRRLYRVGACPILEVTVAYPRLTEEASPAVTRFNETYRAMAEGFLAWGDAAPREEAEAAFCALGASAPYRFDRRALSCSMSAALSGAEGKPARLSVTRTLRLSSRRGEMTEVSLSETNVWRWPELTVTGANSLSLAWRRRRRKAPRRRPSKSSALVE